VANSIELHQSATSTTSGRKCASTVSSPRLGWDRIVLSDRWQRLNASQTPDTEGDFGKPLGLSSAWAANAIRAVGNYGERSFRHHPERAVESATEGKTFFAGPSRWSSPSLAWLQPREPLAKFVERGEFSLCSRGGAAGAQAGAGLSCVTRSI